jgi:protein TonB
VNDIAVGQSSGFDRLDKAALDAVRRWRWSPTLQGGEAVQVRGMVEIPFVLQR